MQPGAIVPGYVTHDRSPRHTPSGSGLQVDQFALSEAKNDSAVALSRVVKCS